MISRTQWYKVVKERNRQTEETNIHAALIFTIVSRTLWAVRVTTRVSPVITCRSPSVIKVHHRPLPSQSSVSDRYNRHSCQEGWLRVYHWSHKFILPHRAQCLTCTEDTFVCICTTVASILSYHRELSVWQKQQTHLWGRETMFVPL